MARKAPDKPSKSKSPTANSLIECRLRGWIPYVVEAWKRGGAHWVRTDMLGLFDILAFDDQITYGIQATSKENRASRIKKLMESDSALHWLACDYHRILVWDWGEYVRPRNGRNWQLCETPIGFTDIEQYRDARDNRTAGRSRADGRGRTAGEPAAAGSGTGRRPGRNRSASAAK